MYGISWEDALKIRFYYNVTTTNIAFAGASINQTDEKTMMKIVQQMIFQVDEFRTVLLATTLE